MSINQPHEGYSHGATHHYPPKADLPATGFIRLSHLLTLIPISSATVWRRVRDKTFPKPIKLGPRTTAWKAEDVRAWIENQGRAA